LKTNNFISHPFIKTVVYANVFIAICAFAQVYLTTRLFHIPNDFKNNSYLVFILLATFLQYNMQRGYMMNVRHDFSERSQWLLKHKKKMFISVGISLAAILFLCNELSWTSISIMVGAEILSTLYYLPPINLRKHGYLKPFLVSLVWVASCCLVPLIENKLLSINSLWYIIAQFIFISVLCMLFDIKDMKFDFQSGVSTYANKFGVRFTKVICVVGMLLFLGFSYMFHADLSILISNLVLTLVSFFIILITNQQRHPFYYYFWIDGLLIFQTLLFFITSFCIT